MLMDSKDGLSSNEVYIKLSGVMEETGSKLKVTNTQQSGRWLLPKLYYECVCVCLCETYFIVTVGKCD